VQDLGLIRIHQYGVIRHGEAQADKYYFALVNKKIQILQEKINEGLESGISKKSFDAIFFWQTVLARSL
jgi:hypothetical protein